MLLTFGISIGQENTEVHLLGESPKVTMESTEAGERDSKMQSDTDKKMEKIDLQGRMQYQPEKQDSSKKSKCMLTLFHMSIVLVEFFLDY